MWNLGIVENGWKWIENGGFIGQNMANTCIFVVMKPTINRDKQELYYVISHRIHVYYIW